MTKLAIHNHKNKQYLPLGIWGTFTLPLVILSFIELKTSFQNANLAFTLDSSMAVVFLAILFLTFITGCFFTALGLLPSFRSRIAAFFNTHEKLILFLSTAGRLLCIALFSTAILNPFTGILVAGAWIRLTFLWLAATISLPALRILFPASGHGSLLIASIIPVLTIGQILLLFSDVTNYPFSLDWSEGSYLYYSSLPFSSQLYGQEVPLSVVYISRSLLRSLPFLLGTIPIWAARLWSVFLWLTITTITSIACVRRIKTADPLLRSVLTGLVFLYFFQVGINYELQLCVLLIVAGFSFKRPWLSALCLVLASAWAGLSRANWYPVPALLAISLYFLEKPFPQRTFLFKYLAPPAIILLGGVLSAFLGSLLLIPLTGEMDLSLAKMAAGDLPHLWYRLLPSATSGIGVLPNILLLSIPFFWLLVSSVHRLHAARFAGIRKAALFAILLVLFLGGLYVSTVIGAGGKSDWHNMDAYFVALTLISLYTALGNAVPENGPAPASRSTWIAILLGIPMMLILVNSDLHPVYTYDREVVQRQLDTIGELVQEASSEGEVLFITERQLLTFGNIPGVALVPEYENVELQTRANVNDTAYFEAFQEDLRNRRFSMIVALRQVYQLQGSGELAGEENDTWVTHITIPVLCYYTDIFIPGVTDYGSTLNIRLYIPLASPACPEGTGE